MKRLAWAVGLALLAALATVVWMRRQTQSRIDAAERRADAARTRLAPLVAVQREVQTFQAWKADLEATLALIEDLKARSRMPGLLAVLQALAPDAQGAAIEALGVRGDVLELRAAPGREPGLRRLGGKLREAGLLRSFELRGQAPEALVLTGQLAPLAPLAAADEVGDLLPAPGGGR